MNLVRYTPDTARDNFFDTMFSDFFAPFTVVNQSTAKNRRTAPKVDIFEKEEKIFINAELPGVNKEEISIDVKGRVLTLSGEGRKEEEIKEGQLYRRECSYGRFERSFTLPFEVRSEQVSASYQDGILHLEIEKPQEEVVEKIAIK